MSGLGGNNFIDMVKNVTLFFIVTTLSFICGCYPYGRKIEKSLRYAAHNRGQLEQVLQYYQKNDADSLKFEAARYLIENMPYHQSYPLEAYTQYCKEMDSLFCLNLADSIVATFASEISSKYKTQLTPVYDILEITSDYLIWNIEYSFQIWEESNFLKHLDFDEFCEYVLPYKCIERQPMSKWKEEWRGEWRGELDQIEQIDEMKYNVRRAVEAVTYANRNDSLLSNKVREIEGLHHVEILDLHALMSQPYATCLELSQLGIMNCRSKALPVSFDFTPNWADRGNPHYWNRAHVSRRSDVDFEPFSTYPGAYHYDDNAMGKVYRLTYTPHPLLLDVIESGETIPSSLSMLFMKDVTSEYGKTTDISVKIKDHRRIDSKYAYLAVFNNSEWVPMDVSRIKTDKVLFENVQLDILYIVVQYQDHKIIPISDPFIVDVHGNINYHLADTSKTQTIRTHRKYPAFSHIYNGNNYKYLRGGKIEASNNQDFANSKIIAEFPIDKYLSNELIVNDTTKYRYWRLRPTLEMASDFAELYFYGNDNQIIKGDLIYSNTSVRNKKYDTPQHICDGDPLTYFAVENVDTLRWVGFDFGKKVSIDKVAYIRRGDGNDICPGDEYELYYWADDGWQYVSKVTAENVYVDFHNVPINALYYIKGLSRGVQNRTFIYNNGVVRWY